MKKLLIIACALTLSLSGATLAHAQGCLDSGCPDTQVCKLVSGSYVCQSNSATCNPACSGATPICDNSSGSPTCIATSQYGNQSVPGINNGSLNSAVSGDPTGFVPLAPIPGLTSAQSSVTSTTIAAFLNNLYKYLIGIAAVLAVIMIIWGGIEIAGESVTKKSDGKAKIQQAILGLVLVLSPALVFSIINPAILNLSLNIPPLTIEGYNSGTPTTAVPGATGPTAGTLNSTGEFTSNQTLFPCAAGGDCSSAQTQCQNLYAGQSGGYQVNYSPSCVTSGGTTDANGATSQNSYLFGLIGGQITACKSGEQLEVPCSISGSGSGPGAYIGH